MTDPVALCRSGRISGPVMLARLVLAGAGDGEIRSRLAADPPLLALFEAHAASLPVLRRMLAAVDHGAPCDPAAIAAQFDAAVAAAPEASVAAYTLGNPALLARATDELVGWLLARRYLRPGVDVVDLGCGIGRVAAALVPPARSVLGLDVSTGMIDEARRRHGAAAELRFAVSSGRDLAVAAGSSCDLLLAVDCFPYLFQAGVAAAHFREAARVLRPGGVVAILNLSYAGDAAADRDAALEWSVRSGLDLVEDGMRPFQLWDATAFTFRACGT